MCLKTKLIKLSFENINLPTSRYKHFTYIVRRNRILSCGCNSATKTHPLTQKHGYKYPFIHSEIDAISKFPHKISLLCKCDVYNVRVNKKGLVFLAKPCSFCNMMLRSFKPRSIWYTTSEGEFSNE